MAINFTDDQINILLQDFQTDTTFFSNWLHGETADTFPLLVGGRTRTVKSFLGTLASVEDGPVGPAGPVGPKGDPGGNGAMGEKGDTGDTGATGPVGPRGLQGDTGPEGPAGPKGDTGSGAELTEDQIAEINKIPGIDTRVSGNTGRITALENSGVGGTGPKGDKGDPGEKGDTGATGPQGPAGADGARGVAGINGTNGADGQDGATGPAGADGATGQRGERGAQGRFIVRLWILTAHGAEAPDTPTATYDGTSFSNLNGWGITRPTHNQETQDIWESFASYDPATEAIDGLWEAPLKVSTELGGGGSLELTQGQINNINAIPGIRTDVDNNDGRITALENSGTGGAGPKGDKGDKGDTGATGPAGPAGPAGEDGTNGTNGADGADGADGATGPAGPKGDTGATGPAGPKGDTGATGPAGPKGDPGDASSGGEGLTPEQLTLLTTLTNKTADLTARQVRSEEFPPYEQPLYQFGMFPDIDSQQYATRLVELSSLFDETQTFEINQTRLFVRIRNTDIGNAPNTLNELRFVLHDLDIFNEVESVLGSSLQLVLSAGGFTYYRSDRLFNLQQGLLGTLGKNIVISRQIYATTFSGELGERALGQVMDIARQDPPPNTPSALSANDRLIINSFTSTSHLLYARDTQTHYTINTETFESVPLPTEGEIAITPDTNIVEFQLFGGTFRNLAIKLTLNDDSIDYIRLNERDANGQPNFNTSFSGPREQGSTAIYFNGTFDFSGRNAKSYSFATYTGLEHTTRLHDRVTANENQIQDLPTIRDEVNGLVAGLKENLKQFANYLTLTQKTESTLDPTPFSTEIQLVAGNERIETSSSLTSTAWGNSMLKVNLIPNGDVPVLQGNATGNNNILVRSGGDIGVEVMTSGGTETVTSFLVPTNHVSRDSNVPITANGMYEDGELTYTGTVGGANIPQTDITIGIMFRFNGRVDERFNTSITIDTSGGDTENSVQLGLFSATADPQMTVRATYNSGAGTIRVRFEWHVSGAFLPTGEALVRAEYETTETTPITSRVVPVGRIINNTAIVHFGTSGSNQLVVTGDLRQVNTMRSISSIFTSVAGPLVIPNLSNFSGYQIKDGAVTPIKVESIVNEHSNDPYFGLLASQSHTNTTIGIMNARFQVQDEKGENVLLPGASGGGGSPDINILTKVSGTASTATRGFYDININQYVLIELSVTSDANSSPINYSTIQILPVAIPDNATRKYMLDSHNPSQVDRVIPGRTFAANITRRGNRMEVNVISITGETMALVGVYQ